MKDYKQLIASIYSINSHLKSNAANAINQSLNTRNWLIEYYIVDFEITGKDRAKYDDKLYYNKINTNFTQL
jgi:hypothetical protein